MKKMICKIKDCDEEVGSRSKLGLCYKHRPGAPTPPLFYDIKKRDKKEKRNKEFPYKRRII